MLHQVNPDMENFDVVLVMGANDVVNSAAQELCLYKVST